MYYYFCYTTLEAVYQETLAMEMAERDIPFEREVELPVFYNTASLPKVVTTLSRHKGPSFNKD